MTFWPWNRLLYLLAIAFVSSNCALITSSATAASPGGRESRTDATPRSVSVEDVRRFLAADKGISDAKVARQLSGFALTERMSSANLNSLEQSASGKKSRLALLALADAAVFLKPPAADVLPEPPPGLNEQQRMLALTVNYLAKTLPKLPNFYAARTIIRFEYRHRPKYTKPGLHDDSSWRQVGSSRVVVTYRDGKEMINPREWGKHPLHPEGEGLVTRGTFGPILLVAFVDADHSGGFTWSRWERGTAKKLAVLSYRVPKEQSHYSVGSRDAPEVTGYHGEMTIDPATGTILRLTVQAEQPLDSNILQGDIMVEYGPVEIGGKTYTCPIRAVSISMRGLRSMDIDSFASSLLIPDTTLLNDMTFDNYHQFRADIRILTGDVPARNR